MTDQETIAVYDAKADDYAAMADDYSRTDPILAAFIADCPPGGRVLDLGCGTGAAAATMASAGLTVDALDASEEMVRRAAALPGVTAHQATFDDVTGEGIYDGIWANFSLLHAPRADMPRILT
ncbi:MAG: class I SAM-dependent methyltransferase, partial [Pseudomonadota bacterium]